MITSFASLPPMEFVMIIMGIISFLALVFLLIWQVMKQRPFTLILIGFLIPIILAGFPAIQSIKIKEGAVEIDKYAQEVAKNPKDTAAVRQLEEKLVDFKTDAHVQNNPDALATVANAQLALGRLDSAASTIQKATRLDPQSETVKATATEIKKQVNINQNFRNSVSILNRQVAKLQQQPGDTATTANLIKTLSTLKVPRYVDASSALVVARSYAVVNQQEKSQQVIDNVLQADTGHVEAKRLNEEIKDENSKLNTARLTPFQKSTIQRKLQFSPVVGDKAAIKPN